MRILILGVAALLAGCVISSTEYERLPTGVTLLETEQVHCDGDIAIEGQRDLRLEEGQDVILAQHHGDDIDWQCRSGAHYVAGDFDCPDGTDYVRLRRDHHDDELTVECFG